MIYWLVHKYSITSEFATVVSLLTIKGTVSFLSF